jgi:histidine ammonia-lyase
MDDEDKAAKAGNAVRTLFQQLQQVRKSYGVNVGFEDVEPSAVSGQQSTDLVSQVLAGDDDFGDDTEVAEQ